MTTNDITSLIIKGSIRFHEATESDIQRIAEIEVENHLNNKNDHPLDRMMNNLFLNEYKKRWEKKLRDGMSTLIVSVCHLSVGFITYSVSQQQAEIQNIYIMPSVRMHNLGRKLCLNALEKMRHASVTTVNAWLVEGRNKLAKFYQSMGFKATRQQREDRFSEQLILTERCYELPLLAESETR